MIVIVLVLLMVLVIVIVRNGNSNRLQCVGFRAAYGVKGSEDVGPHLQHCLRQIGLWT